MESRWSRIAAPLGARVYARDLATARPVPRFLLSLARALLAAIHGFRVDACATRAGALTYVTFLAIVPVLAVGAAVAKGFGAHEALWTFLAGQVRDYPKAVQDFFEQMRGYVDRTDLGTLTALSLILLFWTAVSVLARLETAFQVIWRVRRRRRGGIQRYGNYVSAVLLAPLLLVVASGLNAALVANPLTAAALRAVPGLKGVLSTTALLVPVVVQAAVFTLLYGTLPGTLVPWRAALAGGIAGGLLWQVLQASYFRAQVGVARYNAIYGGFAAIPLSLVFLYTGWAVLLFGAEFAHAWERAPRARNPGDGISKRPHLPRETLLAVMSAAAEAFRSGGGPWRPPGSTGLARDEAEEAVEALVQAGLLVRTESPRDAVLPARAPGEITAREVAAAGRAKGAPPPRLPPELAAACARADREAEALLGDYSFGATPPPPSGTPGAP